MAAYKNPGTLAPCREVQGEFPFNRKEDKNPQFTGAGIQSDRSIRVAAWILFPSNLNIEMPAICRQTDGFSRDTVTTVRTVNELNSLG